MLSRYEIFLVGGSTILAIAGILFFSAATKEQPLQKSLLLFIVGAVVLYFADRYSPNGINPGDIPTVLVKFIRSML